MIEKWQARGVVFWLVFVDPDQDADEVRAHVRDYGYPGRIALDRAHKLVELVGATITPEAAVFAPGRRLVYHGRIDDRFADVGVARAQPTTHELEDALAAALEGRPPAVVHVAAIGCLIDDLR